MLDFLAVLQQPRSQADWSTETSAGARLCIFGYLHSFTYKTSVYPLYSVIKSP